MDVFLRLNYTKSFEVLKQIKLKFWTIIIILITIQEKLRTTSHIIDLRRSALHILMSLIFLEQITTIYKPNRFQKFQILLTT